MHVRHVLKAEVANVVRQVVGAKLAHHLQIVEAVGHGEGLVGGHLRPVDEIGTIKGQQSDQIGAVAQVGQFTHVGHLWHSLSLRIQTRSSLGSSYVLASSSYQADITVKH